MHHILEKNKRLTSAKKRKIIDASTSESSLILPNSSTKSKQKNLIALPQNLSNEAKEVIKILKQIQKDLKMRLDTYGLNAQSTVECLQHFVQTSNDHALFMIQKGEFKVATDILHQCEHLLMSPLGQNYPQFKYQTFNNIAHAHNVQTNVRLSLKYLLKSLDFALQIEGIESPKMDKGQQSISLVETYLNIFNAYAFLNQYIEALEFAERAVTLSHKILSELIIILENKELSQEQKEFFGHQYHQQVNLHSMSFHTKGQIYEKMKRFEDAIFEYQYGKEVIEKNYGTQHKTYIDFVNAINGARLRTKYYQHSNLPDQPFKSNKTAEAINHHSSFTQERRMSKDQLQNKTDKSSLFMQEMERIKPVSQQNGARRIRPSSAKQNSIQNYYQNQKIPKKLINRSQLTDNLNHLQLPKGPSMQQIKSRSIRRIHLPNQKQFKSSNGMQLMSPPSSGRSTSSSNNNEKRQFSSQRRRLEQKIRTFHQNDHSKSRQHHDECGSCQDQIQEIRKLQAEQQRLMSIVLQQQNQQQQSTSQNQQQLGHSHSQMNIQNTQQFNVSPLNQQFMGTSHSQNTMLQDNNIQNAQMYQMPPASYPYYPYPYVYPMMPGMMMMPPPPPQSQFGFYNNPYGYQSGIFLPPMNPNQNPFVNNFMGESASGSGSKKDNQWEQFRASVDKENVALSEQKGTPFNFHPGRNEHSTEDQKNKHLVSNYSDINERESRFGDDFYGELKDTEQKQSQNKQKNSENDVNQFQQVEKPKFEFVGETPFIYVMEKVQLQDQRILEKAAVIIQSFFRRFKLRREIQLMRQQQFQKLKLIGQVYKLQESNKKSKNVMLSVSLLMETVKEVSKQLITNKQVPIKVMIQLYDQQTKSIIFTKELDLNDMRINQNQTKGEVCYKIKERIRKKKFTGYPHQDFEFNKEPKDRDSSDNVSFKSVDISDKYSSIDKDEISPPKPIVKQETKVKQVTFKEKSIDEKIESDIEEDYNDKFEDNQSQNSSQSFKQQEIIQPEETKVEQIKDNNQSLKLSRIKAIIKIQTKIRQIQAKNEVELLKKRKEKEKGKSKICQYLVINENNKAEVTLVKKFDKKKGDFKYKLEIKNMNKKYKKNKVKEKLQQLPTQQEQMKQYLEENLNIYWKNEKIDYIKLKQGDNSEHHINMRKNSDSSQEQKQKSNDKKKDVVENQEELKEKVENNKSDDKKDKLIKTQALIKGFLTRNHYRQFIDNDNDFIMIYKMARRLSDEKLYYIFLLQRKDDVQVVGIDETFYLVTLREAQKINEIYDLEITLDMARKIFGRKDSSTAELQRLIMFNTNKHEFIMMLNSLDIIDGDFSLDFKKFRMMQITPQQGNILPSQSGNVRKDSSDSSSSEDNNIIPEADSKFEVSPEQHKQVKIQEPVISKPQLVQQQQPKKKKLKRIDYKLLALIKIQAQARRYLALKRKEYEQINNYQNQTNDMQKQLHKYKQGSFRSYGILFMYFLYTDEHKKIVKITITTAQPPRKTIISLKQVNLEDFQEEEQNVEIDDIPEYIENTFDDNDCEEAIFDKRSGQLNKEWITRLGQVLDEKL